MHADVPGAGGGEDGAEAAAHRGHLAAVAGGVAPHQLEPADIHHGQLTVIRVDNANAIKSGNKKSAFVC